MRQTTLRLAILADKGESIADFRFRRGDFGQRVKHGSNKVDSNKLLGDLLKRQARQIMGDVTHSEPVAIPAHLERLKHLTEIIEHHLRHDFAGTNESRMSGRQLAYPVTLADFVACLDITKRHHRCPEFVNPHEDKLDQIIRRLDTIAFFQSQLTPTIKLEEEI